MLTDKDPAQRMNALQVLAQRNPKEAGKAVVNAMADRLASFDKTSLATAKSMVNRASLPPDSDLVTAYAEFGHSMTLPGFLARAAATEAVVAQAGLDFEYRLGEYIGMANQDA